ncbi:hypothetical protein EVAR_3833_1 [Eumeta japonica]|uniref:Uncharacterized protein n=1 Tax=Eumeta variegata TaxID=151549 RepID=A0A4C1ST53_EUMVA|nr:hypothetical protein EVAR_3833_1 [Eumeta japonica]
MKQRLLQLNLFLSEWKGRVPFTFMSVSLLLGGLTMPEWKGRVPLTRSHCERITVEDKRREQKKAFEKSSPGRAHLVYDYITKARATLAGASGDK